MGPVVFAGGDVEAVDEAAQVGRIEQTVGDGDGGDGAVVVLAAEVPDCAGRGDVALAAGVDGPEVALALAVLGVLADGDKDLAIVEAGRRDQVIAVAASAEFPNGIFGVAVELPD